MGGGGWGVGVGGGYAADVCPCPNKTVGIVASKQRCANYSFSEGSERQGQGQQTADEFRNPMFSSSCKQ